MNLQNRLENWAGETIRNRSSVGGGCIAQTEKIVLISGREIFIKSGMGHAGAFSKEANGLRELATTKALRVPKVLHVEDDLLILEFIQSGQQPGNFFEIFGRQFAALHRDSQPTIGFSEDDVIGATPQRNIAAGEEAMDWAAFYWRHRLLFQFTLAEKNGLVSVDFQRAFHKLETRIPEILRGSEEPPALLHGDLWRGNFMVSEKGEPVLIDPAVYYGHREADLAMTLLFGGFAPRFYAAYNEAWPLAAGWQERIDIYKLYHVLNHLNLFGGGYLGQAEGLVRKFL